MSSRVFYELEWSKSQNAHFRIYLIYNLCYAQCPLISLETSILFFSSPVLCLSLLCDGFNRIICVLQKKRGNKFCLDEGKRKNQWKSDSVHHADFSGTNLAWNGLFCQSNRRRWNLYFWGKSPGAPPQSSTRLMPIGAELKWRPASRRNVYPSLAQRSMSRVSLFLSLSCTSSVPFQMRTCTKWASTHPRWQE